MPGRLRPDYFTSAREWLHVWRGQVLRLRLTVVEIEEIHVWARQANEVVARCEQHGSTSYREAIMPPMPMPEETDDVAVVEPQIIEHSIPEMMQMLRRLQRHLESTHAERAGQETVRFEAHDPSHDDLADELSYYADNVLSPVMRAAQPGLHHVRWSEPGDPTQWPEGLPGRAIDNAGASGEDAMPASVTVSRRIDQDPVSQQEVEEAERYRQTGGITGFMERLAQMSPFSLFMPRSEPVPQVEQPPLSPYEQKVFDLMSSKTPPTWLELRRLAEDGMHPVTVGCIARHHGMPVFEHATQLRPAEEPVEEVIDDEYDESELGADTDEMVMGEAESWFRKQTQTEERR